MTNNLYTLNDFSESLRAAGLDGKDFKSVYSAWGTSPEGGGSWAGGFIVERDDGRMLYVWGWADYTGWGCQDGGGVYEFDERSPIPMVLRETPPLEEWDTEPADLNEWLRDGADEEKTW